MNASKNISLVLTVIGDDRPGLVEQLATAISKHGGNWLESSMAHLSGKFAGIVCVTIAENDVEALKKEFAALAGLRITAEVAESADATPAKPSGIALQIEQRRNEDSKSGGPATPPHTERHRRVP